MTAPISLSVITKADLMTPYHRPWHDPDGVANITDSKRAALLANPLSHGCLDPVQIVALAGDRPVGRIDIVKGELVANDRTWPMLWASNLHVLPEHRRTGAGLMLIHRLQTMSGIIGVCGVSRIVHPIYLRLRWRDFPMPRFLLLRRSRSIMERFIRSRFLRSPAVAVADLVLALYTYGIRALTLRPSRYVVRELATCPNSLDPLLQQRRGVVPHRSAAYYNWVLEQSFGLEARRRLFVVEDGNHGPLGLLLTKTRFHENVSSFGLRDIRISSVLDWVIFDNSLLHPAALAGLAIRRLCEECDVDLIEFCAPDHETERILRWHGLVRIGDAHCMFRLAASQESPPEDAIWILRPGEGDMALA